MDLPFAQNAAEAKEEDPFVVDVEGFEGPLDLLLDLARRQKVDLSKISVLALVEQYLEFIAAARRLRLELAADYLVTAAWLWYLKEFHLAHTLNKRLFGVLIEEIPVARLPPKLTGTWQLVPPASRGFSPR